MWLKFFGGRFRVNLLFFPVCALFVWHYGLDMSLMFFAAFVLHEGAHALAARAAGASIASMELLPFGCAAEYDGFFSNGAKETCVALAGPFMNIAAASAVKLLFGTEGTADIFVRANIGIAAVNMLPALPLDGGRALTAVLGLAVKRRTAVKISCVLGIVLGTVITAIFVYMLIGGEFVLSIAVFGVFILMSAIRGLKNHGFEFVKTTVEKRRALRKRPMIDVKHIAAAQERSIGEVISGFDPRKYNIVHVIGNDMHTVKTMDETDILKHMMSKGSCSKIGD